MAVLDSKELRLEITFEETSNGTTTCNFRITWAGRDHCPSEVTETTTNDKPFPTREPFWAWSTDRYLLHDTIECAIRNYQPAYWTPREPFTNVVVFPGYVRPYMTNGWRLDCEVGDFLQSRTVPPQDRCDDDCFTVMVVFDYLAHLRQKPCLETNDKADFSFAFYVRRQVLQEFANQLRREYEASRPDALWRCLN